MYCFTFSKFMLVKLTILINTINAIHNLCSLIFDCIEYIKLIVSKNKTL